MPRSAAATAVQTAPFATPALRSRAALALVVSRDKTPALTDLERTVVLLSRRDRSVASPLVERLRDAAIRTFGLRRANRLADPKLEALRRFAVILRENEGLAPAAEIERFVAAGYRAEQVEAVYALCWERNARRRSRVARRNQLLLACAIWVGILPPFAVSLSDYFDDDLIGSMVAMLAFATLAPLMARFRRA